MSKYYTIQRQSRTYSGIRDVRTLWGVLRYVYKTYAHGHENLNSEDTLIIKEHSHYEDVERKQLARLKKIYEPDLGDK